MTHMHLSSNVGPFFSVFFYMTLLEFEQKLNQSWRSRRFHLECVVILLRIFSVLPWAGVIKVKEIDNQSEIVSK